MTSPARSGGDPEILLPLWEIVQTSHLAARAFGEAFAEAGLTPPQFGVLASLADEPDITQAQPARNTLVRPQSVARIVSDLVAAGLVGRGGPGGRGRATALHLTAQGAERLDRAWPAVARLNDPAGLGLTDAEASDLVTRLLRVREALGGTT